MKDKAGPLSFANWITTASIAVILSTCLTVDIAGQKQRERVITSTATSVTPPAGNGLTVSNGDPKISALITAIDQRLASPDVSRGRVGIKIASLNSGKVVFESDADKYFMPASNQKNFTVAAALERLEPDFKFVTSVYSRGPIGPDGIVSGDLRIFGRGDVSISTAFFGTTANDPLTYYKGIDRLVDAIAAAGVREVEGRLLGDESYFRGFYLPSSWEWDDLQWYYGAEISALSINDNAVDLKVVPGNVGGPCIARILPANTIYRIINTCTTTAAGVKRTFGVHKRIDRNELEISGTLPVGDSGFERPITISRPAELFIALLRERLAARGINIKGGTGMWPNTMPRDGSQYELAKLESPPLSLIAAKTMKPSQNMYTETLLWTLGEHIGRRNGATADSAQLGIGVLREFTTSIGIPADGIVPSDGSGLSRHNLITPDAVVRLYTYMAKQSRYANVWRDSLTIGGVDGTLRNRFKGTRAENNARGKTGTINQVSALSGYVTTAAGEQLVFAIIVNGVAETATRTALIDDIVVRLANFDGKID